MFKSDKEGVMKKGLIALALLMVSATALGEYRSFKEALAAGENLLWKQTKPAEAQAAFEQAAALGKHENDKMLAEVRIAVSIIKQDRPEEGIARLKAVLEAATVGDYVLCDAAVVLGDVYSYRLKDNEAALGYYTQALSFVQVDKRKAGIRQKLDRISK